MFPLKDSVVWLIQSNIIGFPIQASTGGGGGGVHTAGRKPYVVAFLIHAPTKGATECWRPEPPAFAISIHAPAKGATPPRCLRRTGPAYFNPRSREGSDKRLIQMILKTFNFNPRSREGSDPVRQPKPDLRRHFNPRSREGSDPADPRPSWRGGHFNPRSREGSDHSRLRRAARPAISIHAPAKGATLPIEIVEHELGISIHAPAKEATKCCRCSPTRLRNFNPRSREGSDFATSWYRDRAQILIHAPAKGATRPTAASRRPRPNFNPRSREGSDRP